MIHKKRLPAARTAQHELVPVRDDSRLHRQVRNIHMNRLSADTVSHLDPEGTRRTLIIRFLDEETERRLDESIETFLFRKVPRIPRHRRPIQRRRIHRVMSGLAFHQCQLASHIIADILQFLPVVRPRHHITVAADRSQRITVRLVQIEVYPLLVNLVRAAVARERLHVASRLLELFQVLVAIVNENILVHNMVARQQQPDGSRKAQPAVRAVSR